MSALLVAICLGMTFIASRSTYWIFRVLSGFMWWGLAFYWVQLPFSTTQSLQMIVIATLIFIGLGCMFWGFWQSRPVSDEKLERFRFPFMKEDEDGSEPSAPTRGERLNGYERRVMSARNGIRERRR